MVSLKSAFQRRLDSWPGELSGALQAYLKPWRERRKRSHDRTPRPYWYLFPNLLWDRYRRQDPAGSTGTVFLRDALLGQYCLFLSVRIQDDLLDGQAHAPELAFVSHRLSHEARGDFAKHLPPDSRFWWWYDRLLRETVDGIFTVERLQKRRAVTPGQMFREYARVASVFKLGMAAVCIRFRKEREFSAIAACSDHLAIFGQILDDLEDIGEDAMKGRLNAIAAILPLTARAKLSSPEELGHALGEAFLAGDGATRIGRALDAQIAAARRSCAHLGDPRLHGYLRLHEQYAARVVRALHWWQVQAILGPPPASVPDLRRRH